MAIRVWEEGGPDVETKGGLGARPFVFGCCFFCFLGFLGGWLRGGRGGCR